MGIMTVCHIDMAEHESPVLSVKELMTRNVIAKKKETLLREIVDIMMNLGLRISVLDEK